ncbi:MAG: ANTAR domain-containing protein [Egibacteraceae bacterium]|jgi:GAF domain-containing protein
MATRETSLSATLIELADTLVSDYDLLDFLDLLLERSTGVVAASAGGVMLTNGKAELQVLASTDERMRLMELFELQRQEGPCVDSYRRGEQVVEDDLERSSRWPQFTPVAVQEGYRSAFAFPLRLRGEVIGALNIFRERPGPVEAADLHATQALADMATIGILQERAVREARQLAGHLQTALNSRVVIEQAKGILAERAGLTMGEAYQALRWYARNHNRRLREVAAAIVSSDLTAEEVTTMPDQGRRTS